MHKLLILAEIFNPHSYPSENIIKKKWKHEKVSVIWKQFSDVKIIEVFLVYYAKNFQLAPNVGENWKLFNGRKIFHFAFHHVLIWEKKMEVEMKLFEIIKFAQQSLWALCE